MTLLFCIIIAFSFFAQSLLGFGGGLIAAPLLSLFLPVQDVVTMLILYQLSMGLLIFKTHKDTVWLHVRPLIPVMIIGVILGTLILKYVSADVMRLILVAYIILHLLRSHNIFDPLKTIIKMGGAGFAGLLGGAFQAMIGSGGPAFILYLKDKEKSSSKFRANVIAILFLSNIPRIIGVSWAGFVTQDIIILSLIGYPGFLIALYLGQKFHDQIPQKTFFALTEMILAIAAAVLFIKVLF